MDLIELIARAIAQERMPEYEPHQIDHAWPKFHVAAKAALQAIEEAGFVIVPKSREITVKGEICSHPECPVRTIKV